MHLFHHDETENNPYFSNPWIPKKKPRYFQELQWLSKHSLIFIAVDDIGLQMIRRFKKTCLFCPQDPNLYDLDFCYRREVWVLYGNSLHFMQAMQLAYTVQHVGATKVLAMWVDHCCTEENIHD